MTVTEVLALMHDGERELYIADDLHGWYLTYGGGKIPDVVVGEVLKTGRLCRKFSGLPGYYWLRDRTIDRAAMYALPRKLRSAAEIYLKEPERDLTLHEALRREVRQGALGNTEAR